LSKLKLAGFKTFVDPTTVLTPGNLVGVVGPNGCGKSNIIDAVRWVLGESRASALRGESMQDVIFNGSTTRKAVSRASVELVFDNAEGRAAGQWSQYAEISVKRVLDRSGESSYFINQAQVRRKDVIDLFLGTGLGPRAYAIIEQGMISRIIEARPEDIRGFLEEAAGVTKYRERRRETEGRLADARENLLRLEDIRGELGERIGHLEGQAAVAERYQALHAQHGLRQNLLWLLKRNEARDARERLAARLAEATRQIELDSARLQALEAEVDGTRAAHYAASEAVHGAQNELFAVGAEVSRLEAERRHLEESRLRLETRLAELSADESLWQGRLENLAGEEIRWRELFDNAGLRATLAEARHEEAALRVPAAEEALRLTEGTSQALRRELAQSEQQARVEETKRAGAQRTLEGLAQRQARLEQERGAVELPDEALLMAREARLEATRQAQEEARQALQEAQQRLPGVQQALREALENERQAQRKLTDVRARRDALIHLQHKVQHQGALGDWLQRHAMGALAPLWKSLRVSPEWGRAVEAALGERLAALPAPDLAALADALADAPPGSQAFLLAMAGADGPIVAQAGIGEPLAGKVDVLDPALEPILEAWLAGMEAVEDLAPWLVRHGELPPGVALVNRQGQILTRGLLCHHAPDARTHGVMERQGEIDALAQEQARREEELALAHEGQLAAEAQAHEIQEQMAELRRQGQALQQQAHGEQVELLKLGQARHRALERREQIERDLAELARQASVEADHLQRAELELARSGEMAELQRARLEGALEIQQEREQALREARLLGQTLARELQEARFSERECAGKLEEIGRNRALAVEQLARAEAEIRIREGELADVATGNNENALQQALALRTARESALAGRRDALADITARLRQLEELRLATEQAAAPLREQVARLRLDLQAAELAESQFGERLAEGGGDEVVLLPYLTQDLKEAALQREVARLAREIAELGAVNLAAVEELQTARERKGYLDAQSDDLNQAIHTLEDAIRRIDRETREQLGQTYNTVNQHFGVLFPRLFGGGEARLVLTGEEILDAGVQIVAQPPGKKNSSIHLLSGGEKALTAIALVFAMFQLNPAPFCMLDEVDAPLDDTNTERFCDMVKRMSSQTQFLFISHSKITMEIAQQLVGVTMQEQGASRVVEVDIEEALRLAESVPA
jgi:chromosome segregation protein